MGCCLETSQGTGIGVEESAPEPADAAHVMLRLMMGAYRAGPALNAFMDACGRNVRQYEVPPLVEECAMKVDHDPGLELWGIEIAHSPVCKAAAARLMPAV